jgi:hypothetical protein
MAELNRKVTIRRKKAPVVTPKSKWWLWLLLAIIAIVVVIFLVKKCSTQGNDMLNESTPAQVEQAATVKEPVAAPTSTDTIVEPPVETPALPQGTLEEKVQRVIRGDFGNGEDRKRALGSEYKEIQLKVNEMYRNGDVY